MVRKFDFTLMTILALMALLSACGGGDGSVEAPAAGIEAEAPATGTGSAGDETGTGPAGGDAAAADICTNEYHPVVEGATWVYGGTSFDGPYSWSATISGVSGSGFVITNAVTSGSGETVLVTHQWACTADGLAALEHGSGPASSVAAEGLTANFATISYSGVSLPSTISVGDSWQQNFVLGGQIEVDEGLSADSTGSAAYHYTAVGMETVTVPAGTFEAIKVAVNTNIEMQISMGAESGPPFSISIQGHTWFVKDIGWVQTESAYNFEGFAFSDLIQLQSYSIP
ncbi:MAG: hypothetical protein KIS88_06360 [Anaerolineales bacterium]|nr:hypothetical protein [Anaerolineales bacterium]